MYSAFQQNVARLGAWAIVLTLTLVGLAIDPVRAQEAKEVKERVLFVSDRENSEEYGIYSMNPDGSEQTRLPTGAGIAFDPSWSPNYKQFVYSTVSVRGVPSSNLVVRKADGSEAALLVVGEEKTVFLSPSWSPDGAHIAYAAVHIREGKLEATLYVVDADGKNRKKLGDGVAPVWSSDGKRILFSALPDSPGPPVMKVMEADGTNAKTLPTKGIGGAWSPDGKRILFTGYGDDRPNVFVMDADGSHITQLTKDADTAAMGPVWAKGGKQILFTRLPKDTGEKLKAQVCVMDADGSNVQSVTKDDSFIGVGMSLALLMRSAGR